MSACSFQIKHSPKPVFLQIGIKHLCLVSVFDISQLLYSKTEQCLWFQVLVTKQQNMQTINTCTLKVSPSVYLSVA